MEKDSQEKPVNGEIPLNDVITFYVSVEGQKTEVQYFQLVEYLLNTELERDDIIIEPFRSDVGSAPLHVLQCMKEKLQSTDLKPNDEAWLIVDRNSWKESQLDELQEWSESNSNYHFAISNPCFEYWLLLHFEDGRGKATKGKCIERLNQNLGKKFDKSVVESDYSIDSLRKAVKNAQLDGKRDTSMCRNQRCCTTVYKLIERLLELSSI